MRERLERIGSAALLVGVGMWMSPAAVSAQEGGAEATEQQESSEPTAKQKEQFAEFVEAGKEAYTAGNFEKAIPFFEQAYEVIPRPELKYRIALSYERSGQPEKALKYYREFLEEKPDTEKRGAVEQTISDLEEELEGENQATVRVESSPSGARVFVHPADEEGQADEPRGETPLEVSVSGGKELRISLEKEGYRAENRVVGARAGETLTYSFDLEEVPTDTSDRPRSQRTDGGMGGGAVAALIVGSVGVVGGGTFYGIGQHCSQVSGRKKNCSRGLYNGSVISSYVGGGLGVAGLGTAAVLWMTGGDESNRRASVDGDAPRLRLFISPQSVGLSGRF